MVMFQKKVGVGPVLVIFVTLAFGVVSCSRGVAVGGSATVTAKVPDVSKPLVATPSVSSSSGSTPAAGGSSPVPSPSSGSQSGPTSATVSRASNAPLPAAAVAKILPVPTLTVSPVGGLYGASVQVSLTTDQPSAQIRYTLDGSQPGPTAGEVYSGPLTLRRSTLLKVWAALPQGPATQNQTFYTVNEVVAVPSGTGDGRWESPIAGLSAAVKKAIELGSTRVILESGTYQESVKLTQNLEIEGGWSAWQKQGSNAVVVAPEQGGTSLKAPSAAIKVEGSGVHVSLQNLSLTGSDDGFGAALGVTKGASLTIKSCQLMGGSGSYSYGLRAIGSSRVTIEDSEISGGNGGSTFAVSADSTKTDIQRSTLDAGTGTAVSYALSMTGSSGTVASSVLWGGGANSAYGAALYSSPSVRLVADTIDGGTGSTSWAVFIAESRPEIVDCLVGSQGSSASYGIWENYGNSVPSKVEACIFFGSTSGLYYDNSTKSFWNSFNSSGSFVSADGTQTLRKTHGDRKVDVTLGPAPELLSPNTTALQVGVRPISEADTDRLGHQRTKPWSVGAYEVSD